MYFCCKRILGQSYFVFFIYYFITVIIFWCIVIILCSLKGKLILVGFFAAPAPFCSIAFRGELFKTDVFEEVELEEEPGTESVPMAPAAKMDSAKKSEKTKNEKQKPGRNTSEGNAGGKKNTLGGSRGKSSRGSSPVPSSRPTSAVLEEERKKPGYKHFFFPFSAKVHEYFIRLIALNEINTRYFRETLNRLVVCVS